LTPRQASQQGQPDERAGQDKPHNRQGASRRVPRKLLVIDATTGQNGLIQAKQFGNSAPLTGLVLTKLDGTAKGGIVFAVASELKIPVKLVCVGEKVDDQLDFDAENFVKALFD
jgi:fused signal recognition particle receptor